MSDLDPILIVLIYSSGAALAAVPGALPSAFGRRPPVSLLGWSNALAAGLMLGVAYSLLSEGLVEAELRGGAGALMGVLMVRLSHVGTGTGDIDLNRLDELSPEYGYQVVAVNVLHGAWEGVAIGVAMFVSLSFGISMAVALAVHNVPEAIILCAILVSRGLSARRAAILAVASKLSQVLLAIVTFAVVGAMPGLLPWALGFAAGALIYLVLAELLPESYAQAGKPTIAIVTLVAMGIAIALGGSP